MGKSHPGFPVETDLDAKKALSLLAMKASDVVVTEMLICRQAARLYEEI